MSQPKWKFVTNLGDASPIDEGGQFIFTDETGVYDPEVEVLERTEGTPEYDDDGMEIRSNDKWTIHRFILEPCTFENGVLSDNKYHKYHPAWFAENIHAVADFIGVSKDEMIDWLCGNDLENRARAYLAISDYYGIINFDEYPQTITDRKVVEARYADCQ